MPAYVVFHNSTLAEVAARRPRTLRELAAIQGVGPTKLERYGEDVLAALAARRGAGGPRLAPAVESTGSSRSRASRRRSRRATRARRRRPRSPGPTGAAARPPPRAPRAFAVSMGCSTASHDELLRARQSTGLLERYGDDGPRGRSSDIHGCTAVVQRVPSPPTAGREQVAGVAPNASSRASSSLRSRSAGRGGR